MYEKIQERFLILSIKLYLYYIMCYECYKNTNLKEKINYIEELKNIDSKYDFGQWNTTSLSFLYIFLSDMELACYHHVIVRVCDIINADKERILSEISDG